MIKSESMWPRSTLSTFVAVTARGPANPHRVPDRAPRATVTMAAPGRDARREANNAWKEGMEERMAAVEYHMGGMKRRMDNIYKGSRLVAEGLVHAEMLWQTKVGGDVKDWKGLKTAFPEALGKDLATHLEVEWPIPQVAVNNGQHMIQEVVNGLSSPGVLLNIYEQKRYCAEADDRVRIKGTFVLCLAFGEDMLRIKKVLSHLDKALRRNSGLKVDNEEPMPHSGAPPRRMLLYPEKTAEERNKGKGARGTGSKGNGKASAPSAAIAAPEEGLANDGAGAGAGAVAGAGAGAGAGGGGGAGQEPKGTGKGKDAEGKGAKGKKGKDAKGKGGKGKAAAGRAGH